MILKKYLLEIRILNFQKIGFIKQVKKIVTLDYQMSVNLIVIINEIYAYQLIA